MCPIPAPAFRTWQWTPLPLWLCHRGGGVFCLEPSLTQPSVTFERRYGDRNRYDWSLAMVAMSSTNFSRSAGSSFCIIGHIAAASRCVGSLNVASSRSWISPFIVLPVSLRDSSNFSFRSGDMLKLWRSRLWGAVSVGFGGMMCRFMDDRLTLRNGAKNQGKCAYLASTARGRLGGATANCLTLQCIKGASDRYWFG